MDRIIDNIDNFIEANNIDKIFLDVDGVILHSCQAIVDILNGYNNTNFSGADVTSWNFKEIDPTLTEDEVEREFNSSLFFNMVQPIDGVIDFIKRHENNITIVTKASVLNYSRKVLLFKQFGFENIPIIGLPLNVSKGIINMSGGIFIDDCVNNLNESNAEYKVLFKEYQDDKIRDWQKDWFGLELYNWNVDIDWTKVEVDTPILVRSVEYEDWKKRYFSKYIDGFIYTFYNGSTSWSNETGDTPWMYAKLADV